MRPSKPERQRVKLHQILEESLMALRPELESREIRVELSFSEELPELDLDPNQIKQAFYNIIRNAYQAVDQADGEISIATSFSDYEVKVSISDNGSGISPEMMGAMFEPFHTTKSEGTGLGMLIVRRILREHGGELEMESEESMGTKVTLYFPRTDKQVRLIEDQAPIEV
jgi:signal transduction histidine kinase